MPGGTKKNRYEPHNSHSTSLKTKAKFPKKKQVQID